MSSTTNATRTKDHSSTARRTGKGQSRRDRFFNARGTLALNRDRSGHRRFAALYDDLLS
ncbi:MAG: hypothetical protein RIA71_13115 [Oceanicaulis sp.]